MPLSDAVDRAIDDCIREGVLEKFLRKHKAEAKEMSIFEYDQEKHMKQEREAAWEDGHAAGIEEGRAAEVRETSKRLSAMGMPIEKIASAVGASVEEVQKWRGLPQFQQHVRLPRPLLSLASYAFPDHIQKYSSLSPPLCVSSEILPESLP